MLCSLTDSGGLLSLEPIWNWGNMRVSAALNRDVLSGPNRLMPTGNESIPVRSYSPTGSVFGRCPVLRRPSENPTETPLGGVFHLPPGCGSSAHMAPSLYQTWRRADEAKSFKTKRLQLKTFNAKLKISPWYALSLVLLLFNFLIHLLPVHIAARPRRADELPDRRFEA